VPIPGAPFDAAGAFFNTLNHLPDAAALGRALAAVAGALRPGALVAFDLNNVAGYQRWWGGSSPTRDRAGSSR
jgi:SAM-dependent methyltransferase